MAILNCWDCGNRIKIDSRGECCPHCGAYNSAVPKPDKPSIKSSVRIVNGINVPGIVGAGLLVLGAYLPFIRASLVGKANLFDLNPADGGMVIFMAIVGAVAYFVRSNILGGIVGVIAGLFVSWKTFEVFNDIKAFNSNPENILINELTKGFDVSVQLDFGVIILFLGVLLMILAAFSKNK